MAFEIEEIDEPHYSANDIAEILYGNRFDCFTIIYENLEREKAEEFWSDSCWRG